MSENNVTAEELLKVALWVHDRKGSEEVWKPLQAWSNELEKQEARALRHETVADLLCHTFTGGHLDRVETLTADTYLSIAIRVVAALDELEGEDGQ